MKHLKISQQVLVVDNNPVSRKKLVNVLNKIELFNDIIEVGDGIAALVELQKETPRLIITCIAMPRMDGIELIEHVKGRNPFIKIIIHSQLRDKKNIIEAMSSGANGFICKGDSSQTIITGIRQVLNNEWFLSPNAIKSFNNNLTKVRLKHNQQSFSQN
ncbi:MAG: response regulator transcription factor [Flavobacteriales bacterium]|nr:response regulator transcription factor [Flavobacteriales bacterium]